VTTRRRKFWSLIGLRRGLDLVAPRFLCLGVLGFGVVVLATFSLPLRRQPAADFSQAFRVLAVSLVKASRLVLAPTPFVQTGPRARAALVFRRVFARRDPDRAARAGGALWPWDGAFL
jgi:hypothetical protein